MNQPCNTNRVFDVPDEQRCIECDNEYVFLGEADSPGVCPACGSRAVTPAGDFEFRFAKADQSLLDSEGRVLTIPAVESGGREFEFTATVVDESDVDDGKEVARLAVVRVEGFRMTPRSENWTTELVPEAFTEFVEEELGYELRVGPAGTGASGAGGGRL